MSEKKLCCSRYVENFIPQNIIENTVNTVCKSVADAFLGQIEYGKDYIVSTELVKEDWANGFGTKYIYNLKFDELVRCRDCKYYQEEVYEWVNDLKRTKNTCDWFDGCYVAPNGFCAWGERKQ